jgi:hypothetical protein
MRTLLFTLLFATMVSAQENYFFASTGFDPKIALIGSDNKFIKHDAGLDYFGKAGSRIGNKELNGYIEVFDLIGYRAIGLQFSHVEKAGRFDVLAGLETSIISRKEVLDGGLNVRWMEYYPSFGANAEIRFNLNKRFAIGYVFNYKTRPDLIPYKDMSLNEIGRAVRFSSYVQLYIKI